MKKLLTIAMISLAAMAAKADLYLYWTLDLAETSGFGYTSAGLVNQEGSAPLYSTADGLVSYDYVGGGEWLTSITSGGSYWIELYDAARNKVAYSQTMTYDQIIASNHAVKFGSETGAEHSTPWNGGSFTSTIPEPTSGLMLLLGLAGLALKRKVA